MPKFSGEYRVKGVTWPKRHDEPDCDYRPYADEEPSEYGYIGVYAQADIILEGSYIGGDRKEHTYTTIGATVRSGGLWGIEADADEDYIDGIYEDEREELMDKLRALGITDAMIEQPVEWPSVR